MNTSLVRSVVLGAGLSVLGTLFVPVASADPGFAAGSRWWWGWHGKRDNHGTPPIITTQPVSQTVATGTEVTISVVAVPDPTINFVMPEPLTYQWYRNGWLIPGATAASLTLASATLDDAGVYSVVVRWGPGWVRSDPAALSVAATALSLTGPVSQVVANGSNVTFALTGGADALTYQWRFHGRKLTESTSDSLAITNAGTTAAGTYSVDVSDATGLLGRYIATLRVHTEARLTNLSTRGLVGEGPERLTVGFVITGTGTKEILVRGIGPTLTSFGVTNALAEPTLTLFSGFGRKLDTNTTWGGTPELTQAFADVGAFALAPDSADSALLKTLDAGIYTAAVTGRGDSTGVALAEVYDADEGTPAAELINISARAFVGTDDKVLTAGFVIEGTTSDTLLIRGIGPTLRLKFGLPRALANTRITIYNADQEIVTGNTEWGDDEDVEETGVHVGAFPLDRGSKDSALVVTLPPGAYTAVISGVNSSTGLALVEVYEVR